jgi:predicted DCC family thiol-disulfide oxidoreductase YuxK
MPHTLAVLSAGTMDIAAHPVVLFDGHCSLCNRTVDGLLRRDRRRVLRFAALQSAAGRELLRHHGLPEDALGSVVLVEEGAAFTRSDAALRILAHLGAPWNWLGALGRAVPRPLRDRAYDFIASRRHRLGTRRATCRAPSPDEMDRFL